MKRRLCGYMCTSASIHPSKAAHTFSSMASFSLSGHVHNIMFTTENKNQTPWDGDGWNAAALLFIITYKFTET